MKKVVIICAVVVTILAVGGGASATPTWYTISFTGTDMFNYDTGVDELYNQDAPRRLRSWTDDTLNSSIWSDMDGDTDGTNDFAEWATDNLDEYGFSYFNLYGATIAADYWDQPYHAVPDNDDGTYGVNSWRNQTFPTGWTGGIVMANQSYNTTDYAFPVWRAPSGEQLTQTNAPSLQFSVEVLMENYDTAFEPDGLLRVWFGGFNVPQDTPGDALELSGIMLVPEPVTICLLGLGGLTLLRRKR
jgi:hypothetical protein